MSDFLPPSPEAKRACITAAGVLVVFVAGLVTARIKYDPHQSFVLPVEEKVSVPAPVDDVQEEVNLDPYENKHADRSVVHEREERQARDWEGTDFYRVHGYLGAPLWEQKQTAKTK